MVPSGGVANALLRLGGRDPAGHRGKRDAVILTAWAIATRFVALN